MNLWERISNWLGFTGTINTEVARMRRALDSGRRAKRSEDYEQALAELDTALEIAHEQNDPLAAAVINLHRADVLILQNKLDEARGILDTLKQDALEHDQLVQQAYVVCSLGTLEQANNQWSEARRHYEAALDVARNGQAVGAEGRAMGHLADTYLHDGNAIYAVHLLRDALPRLDTSGDIELSSYFVGRLGQALIETGSETEGQQLVERALRLAEHMRYRIHERLWRVAMGQFALNSADYHHAREHLARALELFENRPPSVEQVEALCLMSKVCSFQRDYPEALRTARQAESLAAELNDTSLINRVQGRLGIILRAAGERAEAIRCLKVAADAYRESPSPESSSTEIDILRNLAAALADDGEADQAVETYRQAIARAEAIDAALEQAQSRRDLGLFFARQGQMQDALEEWTTALDLYEKQGQHQAVALLYCDMGNVRRFIGQGYRALKEYEQASMLLNTVHDQETRGIVLSTVAGAYIDQGDVETAESFLTESIEIAQTLRHKEAEATRRGNLSWFLLSVGRYDQAEGQLDLALRMSRDLKLNLQVAVQTDNRGLLKDAAGSYEAALALHQEALELVQQTGNRHWEAIIKLNLTTTRLALGQLDEAESLLDETLAVGRKTDDIEVIVRSLIGLGRVDIRRDRAQSATDKINEAVTLARKSDTRRLKAEVLLLQSEQQAALNQHKQAAEFWDKAQKQFSILRDPQAKKTPVWLDTEPVSSAASGSEN
jgi:tetratricopeptide (TPR) repeat protein